MSVKKIYKLQKQISLLKNRMVLHALTCNLNDVMRHSMPVNLVFVDYSYGMYNHYFKSKDLESYLYYLCEYYSVDVIWYRVDFDNTLNVSNVNKEHFKVYNF